MTEWSDLSEEMSELMRRGVAAFDAGDRHAAYGLFSQAVERKGENELALLWKAATAPDMEETISCMERVLELDPSNQLARDGLRWAKDRLGTEEEPAESEPRVEDLSAAEAKTELDMLIETSADSAWIPGEVESSSAPAEGTEEQPQPPSDEEPHPAEGIPTREPPPGIDTLETEEELPVLPAWEGVSLQEDVAPTVEPSEPDLKTEPQAEASRDDLAEWVAELADADQEEPSPEAEAAQEEALPEPPEIVPSWLEEALTPTEEDATDWGKRVPETTEAPPSEPALEEETAAPGAEQADAHYKQGVSLFEENKLEEAIAELREAIRLQPQHADAHNYAGNALYLLERTEESINEYNEAIQINPQHQDAHLNLGIVYKNENRKAEAVQKLQRYLELDPDSAIRSEVEKLIEECEG